MRKALSSLVAVLSCALGVTAGHAQAVPCAGADSAITGSRPDVRLLVRVEARELVFNGAPRSTIELPGCAPADTVIVLERRNLPSPIEAGVTYRDVSISLDVTSRLSIICGPLLAQLLNTAPPTNDPNGTRALLSRACATAGSPPRQPNRPGGTQ